MIPQRRERSGSELVFSLLKTLMVGYQIWGADSELDVSQLSGFLRTTDARLDGAVAFLAGEGLVSHDKARRTVCLTDIGAHNLLGTSRSAVA